MPTVYEKIDEVLKEIRRIQDLMRQGLAKAPEKVEAFRLAKEATGLFTNEIFKRKAEKLSAVTLWTMQTRDGFVAEHEAEQLNGWINLLEEFKEGRKIKSELSSENVHIKSVVDGEDQHIFITEKGSGDHTHLILDGGTGEIRVDPKDKSPHDLIKSIRATLELKTGEAVQVTKSALNFVEPDAPRADVKAYTATKDGYSVLEIYNNGDDDLEDFRVHLSWIQPEGVQERVCEQFNDVTDYLVKASPRSLNMLPAGARVYAINIPNTSVDKKIIVTISCTGMRSGKKVEKILELDVQNRYA